METVAMEQESAGPIEYAPAEQPLRRRLRRWLVPAILLLATISAFVWGPPLWLRAQLFYWQSACARHAAPENALVVREAFWSRNLRRRQVPTTAPAVQAVAVVPRAWSRFYGLLSPPGFQSRGTVFLHARHRPSGASVLVAVDYLGNDVSESWEGGLQPSGRHVSLYFQVRLFQPGNGLELPSQTYDAAANVFVQDYNLPAGGREGVQVYAGQPDGADPTHFTIRTRVGGQDQVIDGWVREYHVELEVRPPPTPPPPASPG